MKVEPFSLRDRAGGQKVTDLFQILPVMPEMAWCFRVIPGR
jgi:hypothetical protein